MAKYTLPQRLIIIQKFYKNNRSFTQTHRDLREDFGPHNRPSVLAIRRIVKKFETNFTLHDTRTPVRQRNARNQENIDAVSASVTEDANRSINRRSQELGLSRMTTWRILRKDLGLHPYKIVLTQELKPLDHHKRRVFANWALEHLEIDHDFFKKIIFSDEAHFWLNGFVNKHNCRFWCENNPHEIHEQSLHPAKVTVWCGLWHGGIIGPYFFEDANGDAVTVTSERYRSMLTDFLWPKLDEINLQVMFFQQDGATPHTANATMELLREKFGESVISRNGTVKWPPRSCDLTPLDFFLWGYLKSLVYANKPRTIDALKLNIERCINEITPDLLHKVTENWVHRIRSCNRSQGGHLNNVLFKT